MVMALRSNFSHHWISHSLWTDLFAHLTTVPSDGMIRAAALYKEALRHVDGQLCAQGVYTLQEFLLMTN